MWRMPTKKRTPVKAKTQATSRAGVVHFIPSMECLGVTQLPEGPDWSYEIKLDGYRLEAVKANKTVTLYSRRGNVLKEEFGYIADALSGLPNASVLDGELVALDEGNRSNFNLLQNFRSAATQIHYYVFDILSLKGKPLLKLPLQSRRELLLEVLPVNDHVTPSVVHPGPLSHLLEFAKAQKLEGVIAKRNDSSCEPGQRS